MDEVIEYQLMLGKTQLLSTLSEAMKADLAISPIVVASEPGIGTCTMIGQLANALGLNFIDVRCHALDPSDFAPLPVIADGEVAQVPPRFKWIAEQLAKRQPALVLLNESLSSGTDVPEGLIKQISDMASAPVIIVMNCTLPDHDEALRVVAAATGIHPALIPTCELSIDHVRPRVQIIGSMGLESSKIGERYVEIHSLIPYDHTMRLTIEALEGQDDDAMNEALDPFIQRNAIVCVAFRRDPDGWPDAITTDDIALIQS